MIIDGQSSRVDQGSRKGGCCYNLPPPIVLTHLCQGSSFIFNPVSQASSHNHILGLKIGIAEGERGVERERGVLGKGLLGAEG